jgi:hypothetical protein
MIDDKLRKGLLDLLNKSAKEVVDKEGALCTNFILVAEFVDTTNEYYKLVLKDESLPPWRHTGLLYHVLETEFSEEEEEEEDGE